MRFQRHKERPGAEAADQRPGDVNASTAKPVCKPGEAGDGQAANPADQQANIQKKLTWQAEVLRRIVQGKGGNDIHRQQLTKAQGDNFEECTGMLHQCFHHRQAFFRNRWLTLLLFKFC
ncbi:hypothetical protein D3C85_1562870 [compost metagenome]